MNWLKSNKFFIVALFLTGILFYNIGTIIATKNPTSNTHLSGKYPFLAPTLFDKESNDLIINFTQLREVMKQRHQEKKLPVGIYFEYLPTGSSIGVNDQMEVEIGSLGKVPAVMSVFKDIEDKHLGLEDDLVLKKEQLDSQFGDLYKRGAGATLSVSEAIRLSLVDSDNTAINALLEKINASTQDAVFDELDLPKKTDGMFPIMSPKSYASVFRNLYLSSYLTNEHSNYMLELLAQSKYNDKLPAGLPTSVKMSHKIGVFTQKDGKNIYNDCGIVYATKRPYILCIMSATDEQTAREEMIVYSKMVYSYVSQITTSK